MFLSNEEIVFFAMGISTLIMIGVHFIKNFYYSYKFNQRIKRVNAVRALAQQGTITTIIVDANKEMDRITCPSNNIGVIIDGKLYNNDNSYIYEKDNVFHFVGIKENFLVTVIKNRR